MKSFFVLLSAFILLSLLSCSKNEPFEELLLEVKKARPGKKEQIVRGFLHKQRQLPLINDTTVVFILHSAQKVQPYVTGDMAGWKADSLPMTHIDGTSYWYKKMNFPPDARIEYKFVIAGKYLPDSLNTNTSEGGFGANSVALMPQYVFPQEILFKRGNAISVLDTISFDSRLLGNKREIFVYRHPAANMRSPVIVFNDGADYLKYGKAQIILDNLIADSTIPPVRALFVNPVKRMKEYWLNEAYLKMIFSELLPQMRKKFDWQSSAPLYMGGVSLGGVISLLALKSYQGALAGVFSQSGALWIEKNKILSIIAELPKIRTRLYLDSGTLENQFSTHEQLRKILMGKKARFRMQRWHDGHNWGNWRGHLKQALTYLLNGEGAK